MRIQDIFGYVKDMRHQSYVKHNLHDILSIVMCAVSSGCDQLADILDFANS